MTIIRFTILNSIAATTLMMLSGCVTTQELSVEQCQTADWEEIGHADGMIGRSGAYFGNHIDQCSHISGSMPNRILWEQGRQAGLKSFCTELNAYKLGREGLAWQPVCPLDNIEKLEEAYNQGRYNYLRQRSLDDLLSPYPLRYGPLRYGPWRYGSERYGPERYGPERYEQYPGYPFPARYYPYPHTNW